MPVQVFAVNRVMMRDFKIMPPGSFSKCPSGEPLQVLNRYVNWDSTLKGILTQIGNQLILGCGNIRIWHIIKAGVRAAVFTLEPLLVGIVIP